MKRIALLLVLASAACVSSSSTSSRGSRGPTLQRTETTQPQPDTGSLDGRPELGQR